MKKLSLLAFVRNDNYLVEPQFQRFMLSIDAQTNQHDFQLIVGDLSESGKEIKIGESYHKNILPVRFDWDDHIHPAFTRNSLALMAETEYICHVNADCMYSPLFVQALMDNLAKENVVFCRRQQIQQVRWEVCITNMQQAAHEQVGAKFDAWTTTGECQALSSELFLKLGGYHQLIKPTLFTPGFSRPGFYSTFGDYKTQAYAEDCDIYHRTKALGIPQFYLDSIPNVWILHLGHPIRDLKAEWEESRK